MMVTPHHPVFVKIGSNDVRLDGVIDVSHPRSDDLWKGRTNVRWRSERLVVAVWTLWLLCVCPTRSKHDITMTISIFVYDEEKY